MAEQVRFLESEIHDLIPIRFKRIVDQSPDQLAISTPDGEITYRELDFLSDRIAHQIIETASPDKDITAICLEQNITAFAAMLGVIKIGKCYIVLPPYTPTAQIQSYLKETHQPIVITDTGNLRLLSRFEERDHIILVDSPWLHNESVSVSSAAGKPSDKAAIFFTSGSTGDPKGVVWSHELILHTAYLNHKNYQIASNDRVAMMAAFGSGAAMTMSFATLLSGAGLFIPSSPLRDATGIIKWLLDERITILAMPEIGMFRQVLTAIPEAAPLEDTRLVILGGGDLYREDVDLFRQRFPTEAQLAYRLAGSETMLMRELIIDHGDILPQGKIPVGLPVQDKELLLLSENREPVPKGQIGEIAIRSRYLATGYWNKPALTAQTFLFPEDGSELRTYLTGDLGKLNADGHLEFLGRKDNMVKIRGFSVQLEFIDQALMDISGISRASSVLKLSRRGKQLVAYMVASTGNRLPVPEIRKVLEKSLPSHMLPNAFVWMDALPTTTTGKVDRNQLPQPSFTRPVLAKDYRPATNELEMNLVAIWETVLGIEGVGIEDDFFDLGGDSLMVLEMGLLCEHQFSKALPQAFFRDPTIANLAELLQSSGGQQQRSAGVFKLAASVEDEEEGDNQLRLGGQVENAARKKANKLCLMDMGRYYRVIEKLVAKYIVSRSYLDAQIWAVHWSKTPVVQKIFYSQREELFKSWLDIVFPDGMETDANFRLNLLTNLFFQLPKAVKKQEKNRVDKFEAIKQSKYPFWKSMSELIANTPVDELNAYFPMEGLENLTRALAQNKGVILLSYHGTPRITQFIALSKRLGIDTIPTISYQIPQRLSNLSSQKNGFSKEEIFSLNAEIALFGQKKLNEGRIVHFASDTNDTVGRVYNVVIGGRLYQIKAGFAELALNTGAPIIPFTRYILSDGREQLEFLPAMKIEPGGREDQVENLIDKYAEFIQNCWQEHPEAISWSRIQRHMRQKANVTS